jgi:hypothetical protein
MKFIFLKNARIHYTIYSGVETLEISCLLVVRPNILFDIPVIISFSDCRSRHFTWSLTIMWLNIISPGSQNAKIMKIINDQQCSHVQFRYWIENWFIKSIILWNVIMSNSLFNCYYSVLFHFFFIVLLGKYFFLASGEDKYIKLLRMWLKKKERKNLELK